MMQTYITNSYEETQELGIELAKDLRETNVIALYGNLGGGKTTFVQGLAKGLGIEGKIISPTFIIMREYDAGLKIKDLTFKKFYHVDLYRIETEKDIEGLGLLEIMKDPQNIVAIEWPEKIEHLLPEKRVSVSFEYLQSDARAIVIEK